MGASWRPLGSLPGVGGPLGHLGVSGPKASSSSVSWAPHGALSGASRGRPGASWGYLRPSWGFFQTPLGLPLGPSWGPTFQKCEDSESLHKPGENHCLGALETLLGGNDDAAAAVVVVGVVVVADAAVAALAAAVAAAAAAVVDVVVVVVVVVSRGPSPPPPPPERGHSPSGPCRLPAVRPPSSALGLS